MNRAPRLLISLALVLGGLVAIPGASASAAPGVTVPTPATLTRTATSVQTVVVLGGSSDGVLVSVQEPDGSKDLQLLRPDRVTVKVPGTCGEVVGTAAGVVACLDGSTVTTVELSTGAVAHPALPDGYLLGWGGDGWYVARSSAAGDDVWFAPLTGAPTVLASGLLTYTGTTTRPYPADEHGVVIRVSEGGHSSLAYLDRRGAGPVTLATTLYRYMRVFLGQRRIWWAGGDLNGGQNTLTNATRAADGAVGAERASRSTPSSGYGAAVGDELVVGSSDGVRRFPADPTQPMVFDRTQPVDWLPYAPTVAAMGDVPVVASAAHPQHEVVRLDASNPFTVAALVDAPARPGAVSLDGGRLTVLWNGTGTVHENDGVTTARELLAYSLPEDPSSSGGTEPQEMLADADGIYDVQTSDGWSFLTGASEGSLVSPSGTRTTITGAMPGLTALSYGVVATPARVTFPGGRYTSLDNKAQGLSLFGSRVVWTTGRDDVSWRDATSGAPTTVVAPAGPSTTCSQPVSCRRGTALWGDRFALRTTDGSIVVWDLAHRTSRTVTGPSSCSHPNACLGTFVLDHDVIAYVDPATREVRSLDLSSPSSLPVTIGPAPTDGSTPRSLTASGGRVAWVEGDAVRWTTLPVAATQPAERLLYALTSGPGLSPNGDHKTDTWSVDTHDGTPGAKLTLTIKLGSTVVRTLTSTASGDVRFTWDGLDSHGKRAVDGTHTWSLTGVDANGRPMVAGGGASSIGGHVVVRSTAPPVQVSAPLFSAQSSATYGVASASWKPAIAVPSTANGYALTYERRTRAIDELSSKRYYEGWDLQGSLGLTTTRTSETRRLWGPVPNQLPWTVQWEVRAIDPLGNTGPWSTPVSTSMAMDDSYLLGVSAVATGHWTKVKTAAAYTGDYHYSTHAGDTFGVQNVWGRHVAVLGGLCSTCGKVSLTVKGAHYNRTVVVDSHASTTQYRHVWLFTVPYGEYDITVKNSGSGTRTKAVVDGFGFMP